MTPARLKEIRQTIAPDMSKAAFARSLGYADADTYRKYESGARQVPFNLAHRMEMAMDAGRLLPAIPEGDR